MSDAVWTRDEVESPCVKICVIHPTAKICTGCFRSLDEIAVWSRMSNEERRAVVDKLPERQGMLRKRRGGRAARTAPPKLSD